MSASSTTSSTSCSQEENEANDSTLKGHVQSGVTVTPVGYGNTSMSTLDRSHYQSLPLSGTRRVTVQFGRLKVVVPWKESDSTVGQLADAALTRYKKAKGLSGETSVRVLRLECASDGGILDMDDVLEEVFDLNYDQILAITDEATNGPTSSTPTYAQIQKPHHHPHQQHHYAQPLPFSRRPEPPVASAYGSVSVNRSASPYRRNSVVEVNSFDAAPQSGLRVSTPIRSSLRTEETTPQKQSRGVTMSPEVEKRLAEKDERKSERRRHYEKNPGRFNRGSDRKSRINDALLEARERIVDQLEGSGSKTRKEMEPGPVPGTTLITFPSMENRSDNEEARQMGIEVNAVFDEETPGPSSSKLSALQVMKIEEGGRIAKDGRIKVGDCIREVDGRPVSQMSIIRARAYLADMATANQDVTLLINRSIESFREQEAEEKASAEAKPIQSALQQANTQYIGHTTLVELVKSSNGFGFTVTGRETSKGERLFYIGTVKPYGVALGHLKSGDRLLEIDGQSTGLLTQPEIVEKLKETMVGAKIKFLVSRVSQNTPTAPPLPPASSENKENEETPEQNQNQKLLPPPALLTPSRESPTSPLSPPESTRLELQIPVNGSGSAGLGVSLKARVSKKSNGSKKDCGIFIKNVMHGGAAFKEGRLRVDDRIVGVEDVDLEPLSNTEASQALAQKLKEMGPASSSVKLVVLRSNENHPGAISRDSSRITVDVSSPSSSRMSSSLLLQSPATNSHSRQSSASSSAMVATQRDSFVSDATTRLDDSEMPESDPFDREAPGRKSLSEKRGLRAAADPQHIKLFQEIKHQRQNSAPTSSTQKRSKSQPRSLSQRNYRSPMKLIDLAQAQAEAAASPHNLDDSDMLNRRSQSMESINRPVESILRGTGPSKVQFAANQHPFPPGSSALMRLKSEESRARDKSRRKSMGNSAFSAMRNFFGFGSKSRDVSPEKMQERPAPVMGATPPAPPPPPPPHQTRRGSGSGGGVFVDYGEPYGLVPQYPHNSTSGYESYADAEFYDRYAAHRYHHHPPRFDDEQLYRQQSGSSLNTSPYVNYGLSTPHAYHVDARVPPQAGGSVSSASLRRAYPDYEDVIHHQQQHPQQQQQPQQRQAGTGARGGADYHHMFNAWFAYTGGGAVGAAPLIKSAYPASPVRIAAASGFDREPPPPPPPPGADRRGRSTSSGAIGGSAAKDKYADARGGGSTRLFIPRHGGGISAATFAFGPAADGRGSPGQFRRQQQQQHSAANANPTAHRFPLY